MCVRTHSATLLHTTSVVHCICKHGNLEVRHLAIKDHHPIRTTFTGRLFVLAAGRKKTPAPAHATHSGSGQAQEPLACMRQQASVPCTSIHTA